MVPGYSCALLALVICATPPSLNSAKTVAGHRAAALPQREQHRSGRLSLMSEKYRPSATDKAAAATPAAVAGCTRRRDSALWWGARGGLGRVRGGGSRRCSAKLTEGDAAGKSGGDASLKAALGLLRGGAGGGYNYDDDYYGGPEGGGEDPYYEDGGGGWGDDGWGGDERGGQGEERYDPYEDDRRAPPKRKGNGSGRRGAGGMGGFDVTNTITKGNKKYGIYALAGSVLLTMMGVSLMFEKNLIRLGNLGFVAGMALFIGPSNVVRYFTQSSKLRGSIIFAAGFFFVFTGHPIIGLSIEVFGFLNLFGNMLPMVWAMASNMPFVKDIIGSGSSKRKKGRSSKPKRSPRQAPSRNDDYDRQGGYGYDYDDEDWDNGGGGGGGGGWGGYEE